MRDRVGKFLCVVPPKALRVNRTDGSAMRETGTDALEDALNALGLHANASQAAKVLDQFDMRGSGALSRADFKALVKELRAFEVGDARRVLDRPYAGTAPRGSYASPPRVPEDERGRAVPRRNAQGLRVL